MMKLKKYVILIPVILICFYSLSFAAITGDANGNGILDLPDAIIILQTMVGLRPAVVTDNLVASTTIVYGNNQTTTVGTQLPNPLIAQLLNRAGQPIAGQVANFVVTKGGGTVFASAVTSDANGFVREPWTMGIVAGTQTVEVRGIDPNGAAVVYATFTATATAGAPQTLGISSGNNQSAQQTQTLPLPVKVIVKDMYGNPTSGVLVAFTANNDGTVLPLTATTNADGEAPASWTLGPALGAQTLDAVVIGLLSVRFNATATIAPPSAPVAIIKIFGDGQGLLQYQKGGYLAVRVIDVLGNTIPGVQVNFSATPGSWYITPSSVTTDSNGMAGWNEGGIYFHTVGQQKVDASVAGLSPVTFTINIYQNVHQFDGYYLCSYDDSRWKDVPYFELVNGVLTYRAGLQGSFNEVDGRIQYVIGMNPRGVMSGQLVLDSLQNATGSGTYYTINQPTNISGNWTCERQ